MNLSTTFLDYFSPLEDPRLTNHNYRHNLHDMLVIAILGTICGADGWTEICAFGKAKQPWLESFLELPHGIPSHDTFGRVFSLLDSETFESCFCAWVQSLRIDIKKEVIAIDGKSVRRSHDRGKNQKMLHLVSAWATENRVMLGQVKTDEKSNEITAIPKLLNLVEVEGSVITLDAMGCQRDIAKQIVAKKADYVLALKENQKTLQEDVMSIFRQAELTQYKKVLHLRKIEKVHDHGRVETRKYTLISARDPLLFELRWPGLKSIGKLEVTRTVNHQVERSTRYFLTSLFYESLADFMSAVRNHWHIEINLHWSLDVSFREDESRVRMGHAAENLAIIRRIALNLLKQDQATKTGISCKRKKAGWDHQYLLNVLQLGAKKECEK